MPANRILRLLVFLALTLPLAAFAAAPITGVVTNKTTNKPSAGDTVTLIRLAQGMQESTRTTTDAHGRYTLQVPDDGLHLVRVTHDKANYFEPAPAGTRTVDLDVYNSAPHVKGVSTEALVLRLQTDAGGSTLRVVENFFVKNDSTPPMTQFSNQPFDFYLPDGAVVEGSAALAPGGMPVQAAPVPLPEKDHFTFLFPIRPGETRFQVSYHVPYTGSLALDPRVTSTTDTVAIMLPKSMVFTPAPGSPYNPVSDEVDAQTYVARNVSPQQPTSFQLSGKGELPRDTQNPTDSGQSGANSGANSAPSANSDQPLPATENTAPGKGLDNPLDPNGNRDPWGKYKWWILSGLALLLAIAAGVLLRKSPAAANPSADPANPAAGASAATPPTGPYPPPASPATHHQQLLQALKEEMFALETERLQHRIPEPDYLAHKAALDLILRRALTRDPHRAPAIETAPAEIA